MLFLRSQILRVCSTCSQGFTRKYSAIKHNLNIHGGSGKIVRFFDYIVGRLDSEYVASDPLLFRKNNGRNFRIHHYPPSSSERLPASISYGASIAGKQSDGVLSNSRPSMLKKDSRHDFFDLDYTKDLVSRAQKIKNLLATQEARRSAYGGNIHAPLNDICGIPVDAFLVKQFDIDYFFEYKGEVCPCCTYYAIHRLDFRDGIIQKRTLSTHHECDPQVLALAEKDKVNRVNRDARYVGFSDSNARTSSATCDAMV